MESAGMCWACIKPTERRASSSAVTVSANAFHFRSCRSRGGMLVIASLVFDIEGLSPPHGLESERGRPAFLQLKLRSRGGGAGEIPGWRRRGARLIEFVIEAPMELRMQGWWRR